MDTLYSKTSLCYKGKKFVSKKKKCFKTKDLLDFSKEQNIKLDGKSLTDFHIAIELKHSTQMFQKSKFRLKYQENSNYDFSDPVVAALRLGPNEPGNKGNHWKKMLDKPDDRIFMWHELTCAE